MPTFLSYVSHIHKMPLEEYVDLARQVDKALVLRGLGLTTVFLLALQLRQALITRQKVIVTSNFVSVNADIISVEVNSYGWVIWYHRVMDRRFQIHFSRKGNHRRRSENGVYRSVSRSVN